MIEFQAPQLEDKVWVDALLHRSESQGCEYNFTNLYTWKAAYHYEIGRWASFLLTRLCGSLGCSYLYPMGDGSLLDALAVLEAEAAHRGQPLRLVCVTGPQRAALEALCPGRFQFEADRSGYDYVYDITRLSELGGKRLHGKRNHIHRFEEANEGWTFEPLTPENLPECVAMDAEWYRRNVGQEGADLRNECIALRTALTEFVPLQLEGGLLRVEGAVVAFAVGDRLTQDTYDIHFEKAYAELQGAYAMINRSLARWIQAQHPEVLYLNREDDMGIEGLRRAKESYYPDLMVEKYSATQVSPIE